MTLKIDLPLKLEKELAAEANDLGLPLEEYARRLLAGGRVLVPTVKTGRDLVAYWKTAGVIGSRKRIKNSQKHARQLRAKAQKRRRD